MTQADNIAVLDLATEWHTPHSPSAARSTPAEVVATATAFLAYIAEEPVGALAALTAAVAQQKQVNANAVRPTLAELTAVADVFMTFVGPDS